MAAFQSLGGFIATFVAEPPSQLTTDQSDGLTTDRFDGLTTDQSVVSVGLTTDQSVVSVGLTTDQSYGLTTDQSVGLTTDQSVGLTTDRFDGLTTDQSVGLTTDSNTSTSQSTDLQPESCKTLSSDQSLSGSSSCDEDMVKLSTSVPPAGSCCSKSESKVIDRDVTDSRDVSVSDCHMASSTNEPLGCVSSCTRHSTVERETLHSVDSSLLQTDSTANCQSTIDDVSGTLVNVVASNLRLSFDSGSCDVLSMETESKPAVGFSQSDAVDCVDDTPSKYDTQTETLTRNNGVLCHMQCAVTDQTMSSTDTISTCPSVGGVATVTDSIATKLTGKSSMRCVLTASLSEVSQPAEETVTHIVSTHVHVTDEFSVINGVVQPVESPVKIGEFLIL